MFWVSFFVLIWFASAVGVFRLLRPLHTGFRRRDGPLLHLGEERILTLIVRFLLFCREK